MNLTTLNTMIENHTFLNQVTKPYCMWLPPFCCHFHIIEEFFAMSLLWSEILHLPSDIILLNLPITTISKVESLSKNDNASLKDSTGVIEGFTFSFIHEHIELALGIPTYAEA